MTRAARTVLHGSAVAGRPKPSQSGPDTSLEGCMGLSGITYALGGAVDDYLFSELLLVTSCWS